VRLIPPYLLAVFAHRSGCAGFNGFDGEW
jgi:hypothetical protein